MSQNNQPETQANGVEVTDLVKDNGFTELHLSTIERQVLELHDRLEELQLEISYLQAQHASVPSSDGKNEPSRV